jgi:hypothetical protein
MSRNVPAHLALRRSLQVECAKPGNSPELSDLEAAKAARVAKRTKSNATSVAAAEAGSVTAGTCQPEPMQQCSAECAPAGFGNSIQQLMAVVEQQQRHLQLMGWPTLAGPLAAMDFSGACRPAVLPFLLPSRLAQECPPLTQQQV